MRFILSFLLSTLLLPPVSAFAQECGSTGIYLQVLGSGGPEINDSRASSSYLVWQNGHARIMVDIGPGSMLRYEESGANIDDLSLILLSHLHVDHSADLPALIKGSFFTDRQQDLALYGPGGNAVMPDTIRFVNALFAEPDGAWRYLSDYLGGGEAYRLVPHNVSVNKTAVQQILTNKDFKISAVAVHHGPIPALAWRVDIDGRSIVFSGDMNGDMHTLPELAADADLLVAHHAIPENASGVARNLHMPPSVIGEIAGKAKVKRLVLSHRMLRTRGHERESKAEIRKHYQGPLHFAEDGQCFKT